MKTEVLPQSHFQPKGVRNIYDTGTARRDLSWNQDEFNDAYYPKNRVKVQTTKVKKSILSIHKKHSTSSAGSEANASIDDRSILASKRNHSPFLTQSREKQELVYRFQNSLDFPLNEMLRSKSIRTLDISHNKISKIPAETFTCLPHLTKIVLDYNMLSYIPQVTSTMPLTVLNELQEFSAANNLLAAVPMTLFVKNGVVPR